MGCTLLEADIDAVLDRGGRGHKGMTEHGQVSQSVFSGGVCTCCCSLWLNGATTCRVSFSTGAMGCTNISNPRSCTSFNNTSAPHSQLSQAASARTPHKKQQLQCKVWLNHFVSIASRRMFTRAVVQFPLDRHKHILFARCITLSKKTFSNHKAPYQSRAVA